MRLMPRENPLSVRSHCGLNPAPGPERPMAVHGKEPVKSQVNRRIESNWGGGEGATWWPASPRSSALEMSLPRQQDMKRKTEDYHP
jgi:hypothetical protein